jgi:predicted transcriptional regulator
MRIETTPKQTPGSLASGTTADRRAEETERFVWEKLAPRLLHPSKLAFIEALLKQGKPLTVNELAEAAGITKQHARYQCRSMQKAGVLKTADVLAGAEDAGEDPSYFFPEAPRL